VTNPANNKSVVVRVNDRGPFHADRIIDLSYVAAAKLDLIRRGSGAVIVERVFADGTPPINVAAQTNNLPVISPASPITNDAGALYLQLGAFSSMDNAEVFRARMTRELDWNLEPITVSQKDGLFRVRLGPYNVRAEAEAIAAKVKESHDFYPVISKP
jgi:rare lipoprotein A